MSSKKKETVYLSISLTVIPPRDFDIYMIWFCFTYYLNLLQIGEKQAKVEVALKKVVETKLSIQHMKNNLQQLKEIALFII